MEYLKYLTSIIGYYLYYNTNSKTNISPLYAYISKTKSYIHSQSIGNLIPDFFWLLKLLYLEVILHLSDFLFT